MFRNKTVMKIFSLLAAILLWFYVMGEIDPETKEKVREIPVSFTNAEVLEESGLAAVQKEELFVSATIKGKRSYVNNAKKEGITASVDVSACEKGSNTCRISVNLPAGVSLESVSQSSVRVKVEALAEEEKPVSLDFEGTVSGGDKAAWILQIVPKTVLIKGAKSAVAKVTELKGVIPTDKAVEEKSKWVEVPIVPVTKKGEQVFGIDSAADEAEARIQILMTKTVDMEISVENLDKSLTIDKIDGPQQVRLAGPVSVMEEMNSVHGVIDLDGIAEKGSVQIDLQLPEGVFVVNQKDPLAAEVILKKSE